MLMYYLLTISLLILPIIWLLTDYRGREEQIKWYLGAERILRNGLIIIIIFTQFFLLKKYPGLRLSGSNILVFVGTIIYCLGLFLTIWGKLTMKSVWGTPAQHDIKRQNKLIVTGPFLISRNPIYTGDLLIFFGYFLALRSYLVVVLIGFWFFVNKIIIREEKILEKHFGEKYLEYKKKVRRYI